MLVFVHLRNPGRVERVEETSELGELVDGLFAIVVIEIGVKKSVKFLFKILLLLIR